MRLLFRKLSLSVLLLLAVFAVSGQTANFTADYTSGCAPLLVHFTNTSSGASGYNWDLGNSITSTLTNPSTGYLSAGTYTVTLTASGGSSSSTHSMVITVYPTPAVSFTVSDTSVCPGQAVTFTSTSSAGVTGPLTYIWNFGDGLGGTTSPITHLYGGGGYYNVTLFATNSQSCVSSLTKSAYIHVLTAPVPSFSSPDPYICHPPGAASFSNTSTGTGPLSYAWSFGNGGSSSATAPSENYTTPGYYSVTLVVTDANGCKDSLVRPGYIYVGNLLAGFTGPAMACVNAPVVFNNTSSSHVGHSWNFGDGSISAGDNGVHTYTTPGTYTVTLVAFDGACYDTITHVITIVPGPAASFIISPAHPCPAPDAATFTATVPGGSSVTWLYGDGSLGSGTPASHTYTQCGRDTVRMVTTGSTGCRDTVMQVYTIYNLHLSINHDSVAQGCVPLTVLFNCQATTTIPDTIIYPYGISSYNWNFGDGSAPSSGGATITHTYTATGVYAVTVNVITANGCPATATLNVLVGTPPVASFSATPTHVCANQSISFVNTSTGATSYLWNFGDSSYSIFPDPSYTYPLPGTFTVTLIAYNNGCPDTMRLVNYVTIDSPTARINDAFVCIPRNEVSFEDLSYGDDMHTWIFGDGTTSTLSNPVHDYPALTIYTVTLATFNTASGCRDTTNVIINLTPPVINFFADDSAVCRDATVKFTPYVTGDSSLGYYWYVNGLYVSDSVVMKDTFHVTGLNTIMLIIKDDHNCFDTLKRNNYVLVAKPVAHFTAAPPSGCVILPVTFTDNSTDAPGVTFSNYLWTFGDGATLSTGFNPITHSYTASGSYTVKEIVTDNLGCKDTLSMPALVNVYQPHAAFYTANPHVCSGSTISFINVSTGGGVSSFWMFGDGTTSTATSPSHTYTGGVSYTVTLVVTDAHGCTDTASYPNYITLSRPTAAFTLSDTASICIPLQVTFLNASTGAVGYYWMFGDGNSATSVSPGDLYTVPGIYTVTLVATDINGCKDTTTHKLEIYGYAGAFTYSPLTGCAPLTVHFHANISNVPNIIWDFADGTTALGHSDDTVHTYTQPGGYVPNLILSDNTGCQNSSRGIDTIKVDAVRVAFTTMPEPVCQGGTFNFVDTSYSYWSVDTAWVWSFGDTTSTLQSPSWVYSAPGTYTVSLQATDAWGCTAFATGTLFVNPPPLITACPDTTICFTDTAKLTAHGGISYTWSPTATLGCVACDPTMATPSVTTTYTVTGTDALGCKGTDTVTVFVKDHTTSGAYGDTAICLGTKVPLYDTGGTKYHWSPALGLSSTTIADPMANPSSTTTYTVTAQLGRCISDVSYVTVTVYPLPAVNAGPDQNLVAGSVAQLQATSSNATTYSWQADPTLSCLVCYNPVASMSMTTTYTIDVTSPYGCRASDSVTIRLFCDKSQLFIPNAFTPNGDGQNDVFYPRGTGISNIKSFRIYNRWGELLFERSNIMINDESNAWDGSYGDITARPDVYVYIVDAVCETGEPIFVKGDVTIIR